MLYFFFGLSTGVLTVLGLFSLFVIPKIMKETDEAEQRLRELTVSLRAEREENRKLRARNPNAEVKEVYPKGRWS